MYKLIMLFFLFFQIYLPIIHKDHTPKMAFVGDSLTWGAYDYRDGELYGFAGRVSDYFGYNHERFVFFTFPDTRDRWGEVIAYNPDTIVIELGLHVWGGKDTETKTIDDIHFAVGDVMDRSLLLTDNVVYVLLPLQSSDYKANTINAIIEYEAELRGIKTVAVRDDIIACGDDCMSYDDFHPNGQGHQIIANGIINALVVE